MNNISKMSVCPKCKGMGKMTIPEGVETKYIYKYDPDTNTAPCNNCGLQYNAMPTGIVPLNIEGNACLHVYSSQTIGNCLTEYRCKYCNDTYAIDSSD